MSSKLYTLTLLIKMVEDQHSEFTPEQVYAKAKTLHRECVRLQVAWYRSQTRYHKHFFSNGLDVEKAAGEENSRKKF